MTLDMMLKTLPFGVKTVLEDLDPELNSIQKISVYVLTTFRQTRLAFIDVDWTSKGHKPEMSWST